LEPFYLLVFLAGLLIAQLLLRLLRLRGPRLRGDPFERRAFLDAREFAALGAAANAAGPQYLVFAKVAASSLIQPEGVLGGERRQLARRLVQGWVLDLVVATAEAAQPLCVIQFDPPDRRSRRANARLIAACSAAGLPVITLSPQDSYDHDELRHLIRAAVQMTGVAVAPTLHEGAAAPSPAAAAAAAAAEPAVAPVLVAPSAARSASVGSPRLDRSAAAADATEDEELALLANLSAALRTEDDPNGEVGGVRSTRAGRSREVSR